MKKQQIFLSLTLALLALASCNSETPGEDTTDGAGVTETTQSDVKITLLSAEVGSDYVFVRKDEDNAATLDTLRTLRDAVKEACGVELPLKTDWYKDTHGFPPTPHEILVGETNREETLAVMAEWRPNGYMDWTLRLMGEKLVVYGGSSEALDAAVAYLIQNYVTDGTISVPEGLNYTYQHNWALDNIRLGDKDIAAYQIVYAVSAEDITKPAAEELQAYIRDNTGVELEVISDTASRKEQDCEILIGNTMRNVTVSADTGKYGYCITMEGDKVVFGGSLPASSASAVAAFTSGNIGETKDKVFTLASSHVVASDDVYASGLIDAMKSYVEPRAALGRAAHLSWFRKWKTATNLLDIDIYGNYSMSVLWMPEGEINDEDIALANKIIRKVTGYMTTDIPTQVKEGLGIDGENDFAANRLCRALYAPEGRMEPETMEMVKRFFLNDDFESRHFSENHMLMFRTARYLAACYYEGETFNQYKMTAEEIRQIDYEYLKEFLQYRACRGWAEFDSISYGQEDFLSLINLYDCAPDEDIKTLAQMSMDSLLLSMIVDTTENGIYGGAHGRVYDTVVSNMKTGFFYTYQLYFGATDYTEIPQSMPGSNAPFTFTSDYRPDDSIYAVIAEKTYPFSNYEVTHNHATAYHMPDNGLINKYTYNTELYSIGCVTHQDGYTPGSTYAWYEEHQQTNWSMTFAENSKATLTTHHPGNSNLHAYWYGDASCCCNHLFGNENIVMGIYYIPGATGLYDYIHAYVPKAQFTEVVEQPEQNRIFVRLGDAYAVLRFSQAYTWSEENESEVLVNADTTKNLRLAMVCEAGDKETYGSFEAFISAMEKKEMVFDRDTLTLSYDNLKLQLEYEKKQTIEHAYIDGVEQVFPYTKTYDSPYMQSELESGVIEVIAGGKTRVLDFMKIEYSYR